MITTVSTASQGLLPYVPRLLMRWTPTGDDPRHMRVRGTLAFVDISGFTKLTERLARKGKVGAEEMSDILSATFAGLLTEARADGADLVKWGGDAVLLLFQGPDHALRAARSAYRMRATLRTIGRLSTTSGAVTLRMSVGIHSGDFDFFLVGDPELHRELLISGPAPASPRTSRPPPRPGRSASAPPRRRCCRRACSGTVGGRPAAALAAGAGRSRGPAAAADRASTRRTCCPGRSGPTCSPGTASPSTATITVAFVQFSGTDELLDAEGPVAVAEALDDVVRNVQGACADHDVTFFETDINRDGGKIMLTAGAPRSAGSRRGADAPRRAAGAGPEGRLPLRIGINRGASSPATSAPRSGVPTRSRGTPSTWRPG